MRIKVCKEDELAPGDVRTVTILASTVAVFRLGDRLYGLEADCKHEGACIANGTIDGTVVACPEHGWRYDIPTGECLEKSDSKLKTYTAYMENGYIWVDVTP
jgi:nitrite reductase/ring-hydroxylating ferredoxin subunit